MNTTAKGAVTGPGESDGGSTGASHGGLGGKCNNDTATPDENFKMIGFVDGSYDRDETLLGYLGSGWTVYRGGGTVFVTARKTLTGVGVYTTCQV